MSVPKQNYWAGYTIIILYIIISVTIILSIVLQIVALYIYLTTQVNRDSKKTIRHDFFKPQSYHYLTKQLPSTINGKTDT